MIYRGFHVVLRSYSLTYVEKHMYLLDITAVKSLPQCSQPKFDA